MVVLSAIFRHPDNHSTLETTYMGLCLKAQQSQLLAQPQERGALCLELPFYLPIALNYERLLMCEIRHYLWGAVVPSPSRPTLTKSLLTLILSAGRDTFLFTPHR